MSFTEQQSAAPEIASAAAAPAKTLLAKIPRGMTCAGVHRAVVEMMLQAGDVPRDAAMLDIPCGRGDLIESLRLFFSDATFRGVDLYRPAKLKDHEFAQVDVSRPFRVFPEVDFQYLFCVSGIMEWENTLQFFHSCAAHLRPGGKMYVSNDNVIALADRLHYLFFGRLRQYRLFLTQDQPEWKVTPTQNLVKIVRTAGFRILEVKYVNIRRQDWLLMPLLLPLALVICPIQYFYLLIAKTKMPIAERLTYYPFRSIFCRHYILVCEKVAQ